MTYYSQWGQDKYVYENLFKNKSEPGYFLEIGADDGIRFSNCKFFEETLNWKGIAIEPRASAFKKLEQNRTCICKNVLLSNEEKIANFMDIKGYGLGLSGIVEDYDPRHVARIKQELTNTKNEGYSIIQLPTVKLSSILDEEKVETIDFLSIDTEGSEMNILKTLDFNKYRVNVITIEDNYNNPNMDNFFASNGFELYGLVECDKIYKHKDFVM